ncbi:MAG: hypothetical protein GY861_15865 [bacterium]|nr:hypothetical protein [bacterium]
MNKKAQGMMGPRKIISLILGFCLLILGAIPLLNLVGAIGFSLPPLPVLLLHILCIIGGLFLLIDAVKEGATAMMGMSRMLMIGSYVIGLIILVVGGIPILNQMGTIAFVLPAFVELTIDGLFVVAGALLIYGGTQGF